MYIVHSCVIFVILAVLPVTALTKTEFPIYPIPLEVLPELFIFNSTVTVEVLYELPPQPINPMLKIDIVTRLILNDFIFFIFIPIILSTSRMIVPIDSSSLTYFFNILDILILKTVAYRLTLKNSQLQPYLIS